MGPLSPRGPQTPAWDFLDAAKQDEMDTRMTISDTATPFFAH